MQCSYGGKTHHGGAEHTPVTPAASLVLLSIPSMHGQNLGAVRMSPTAGHGAGAWPHCHTSAIPLSLLCPQLRLSRDKDLNITHGDNAQPNPTLQDPAVTQDVTEHSQAAVSPQFPAMLCDSHVSPSFEGSASTTTGVQTTCRGWWGESADKLPPLPLLASELPSLPPPPPPPHPQRPPPNPGDQSLCLLPCNLHHLPGSQEEGGERSPSQLLAELGIHAFKSLISLLSPALAVRWAFFACVIRGWNRWWRVRLK